MALNTAKAPVVAGAAHHIEGTVNINVDVEEVKRLKGDLGWFQPVVDKCIAGKCKKLFLDLSNQEKYVYLRKTKTMSN